MTETNSHQTEHHETETDPSQSPPTNRDASEQSESESRKPWRSLSVTAWLAIAGGIGTALGAGLTSAGEVLTSYLEFNSQFRQRRQEFEFELIREALEVQPAPQVSDQEEQSDDSEETDEVVSFAQDPSLTEGDADESGLSQDEKDRQRAADELEFYVDIGIIRDLERDEIKKWIADRKNDLPRLQSPRRSLGGSSRPSNSSHNSTPYCFYVQEQTSAYSTPSYTAELPVNFNVGDLVYATTSNPTEVFVDGINFVEVAIYDGNIAWVPRWTRDGNRILIDYPPADCPNPGINAAGSVISYDENICFLITQPTNLYARPDFAFPIDINYAAGDIAYASFPFESVGVQGGRNSFVLVDIYEGNKAWLPRYPENSNITNVIDYPPKDCL